MGDRSLRVDLRRPERAADAIVGLAGRVGLDAVVAVDDGGVAAAALAGERLGLPHNPPAAAAATRDKLAMRRAFHAAGILQPGFRVLAPGDDPGAVELPAVLKPVALSASRGVIRADDPAAARAAEARIRAILADAGEDPAGPILAETYEPGAEVAVEGAPATGRARGAGGLRQARPARGAVLRGDDLRHALAPARGSGWAASRRRRPPPRRRSACGRARCTPSCGSTATGIRVLELAARSIGGLCSRALRFGAGISLEEVILRHALRPPARRRMRASGRRPA